MSYLFLETASGLHSVHACAGKVEEFQAPKANAYKIECWGASGGDSWTGYKSGYGGYTSGLIRLRINSSLGVFVGQKGENAIKTSIANGGWNGGAIGGNFESAWGCPGGGGATDVRLSFDSDWNIFSSLKTRLMVAGAGGGCGAENNAQGGDGGGLVGGTGGNGGYPAYPTTGGTQISGGTVGTSENSSIGRFGYALQAEISVKNSCWNGGAGGGYYGGACGYGQGGAGGSSFISGYTGCNAIAESSTETNIIHTGSPNHYSGYVFTNGVMKAGNESMPSPSGGTETGHTGNGYAKIMWAS